MRYLTTTLLASAALIAFQPKPAIAGPSTLNATDVCIANRHCVGHGLTIKQTEQLFGLKGRRYLRVEDTLSYSCFKLGNLFVLAMYSSQGRANAQPEQLDVSTHQQTDCVGPREATLNLKAILRPVAIGDLEQVVVAKFGTPAEIWQGPKPAYEIREGDHALVYRSADREEFVLVMLSNGGVTRVLSSIAP